MADESNTETKKIDIHVIGETETQKIDIHVTHAEGKINCTVQNGERECLLEGNSSDELWIDQVKRRHSSGQHKERRTSNFVSIYRVPEFIKKNKREAYDPLVVSLGPHHHKKDKQLTAADEYKLQAVDRIVEKIPGMTIEGLVAKVKELEKEIRDCYEDSAVDWDGDTLSWIMTMDACFILQFLYTDLPNSSLIFQYQRWLNIKREEIAWDILKLENQIPFVVLKMIAELVGEPEAMPALAHRLMYIGRYFRGYPFSIPDDNAFQRLRVLIERNPCHLLDLSRKVIVDLVESADIWSTSASHRQPAAYRCLRPSFPADSTLTPSVEKLQRAGIKLKPKTGGKFHFQPRYFLHSALFVPQIIVDDATEVFLRNLVALEICQKHMDSSLKPVISDNMWVMDQLIDSTEDVKLFERADIIKSYLGNADEVARIFNDLCIGITYENGFDHFFKTVNEHYKSRLIVLMSQFREERCSKPLYIVSIVAAVLLLVMTLLQTIYTMKGYFRT